LGMQERGTPVSKIMKADAGYADLGDERIGLFAFERGGLVMPLVLAVG
jgi:hypothetical protein